jgi:hypothetical protein
MAPFPPSAITPSSAPTTSNSSLTADLRKVLWSPPCASFYTSAMAS